jgi:hypothetical protein
VEVVGDLPAEEEVLLEEEEEALPAEEEALLAEGEPFPVECQQASQMVVEG